MNIRNYDKNSVQFIEVTNNSKLKVTFANLGASIFSIVFNGYIMTKNVKDIKNMFQPQIYHGRTIGRFSNRMRGHKFKINDEVYELEPNEGDNVLHGGKKSLAYTLFEQNVRSDDSYIYVTYFTEIKDMEDDLPGNLRLEVKYYVSLYTDEIKVEYRAYSDKDTILSITNHSYFNLGCRSINGLTLQINADKFLSVDPETLLPVRPTEVNEVMDFREPKRINKHLFDQSLQSNRLNGYDHYYYLNNKEDKACTLSNKRIDMDIYTNFDGIQIYTSGFNPGVTLYPETGEIFDSVAIEPSDSFEQLHLLKKDTLYFREIKYIFLWKE